MTDTPETNNQSFVAENNEGKELCVEAWFCEIMERERDLWKLEATRWRDMYMEYDEMLEGQVREAVERLSQIWEDLDDLKQKVQDDLLND